jgi:hypothetical protein
VADLSYEETLQRLARRRSGLGTDRITDPGGRGLRIWFQVVSEAKTVKNRLHLDICASGGRAVPIATRKQRVDAERRGG